MFKTTETQQVNNYPYGSLKCTAYFGLEFQSKKGFRTTFQTINAKTGRLNNPKKSTYSPVIAMYQEEATGHIKYRHFSFNGIQQFNAGCKFMADNFDLFTPEQISDIYAHVIMMVKMEMQALAIYCGADKTKVLELLTPVLKQVLAAFKAGVNDFENISFDEAAINALKVPDFNPFTVTERTYLNTI